MVHFTSIVVTVVMVTLSLSSGNLILKPKFPCHVSRDEVYRGIRVDCQRQGISSLPLPEQWIPADVTSVLLGGNAIAHLNNDSFATLRLRQTLIYLSLSSNEIKSIQPRIFYGFNALERLDLSNNKISAIEPLGFGGLAVLRSLDLSFNKINLSNNSLRDEVFHGLRNLSELELRDNQNTDVTGSYSNFLFRDLQKLVSLSLDTFSGDLRFGSLFSTTKHLSRLRLSGGMTNIKNDSFVSFASIRLKEFIIERADSLHHTEADAFHYFKNLDQFKLIGGEQGIKVTFESLAPFKNRTMKTLFFDSIQYTDQRSDSFTRNSVLTRHMARFLSQICVENFTLTKSRVFIIENGIFTDVWRQCVRYLVFSDNPLWGERYDGGLQTFQNLEYLETNGRKYIASNVSSVEWRPPKCDGTSDILIQNSKQTDEQTFLMQADELQDKNVSLINNVSILDSNDGILYTQVQLDNKHSNRKNNSLIHQYHHTESFVIYYWVPKLLRIVKLNSFSFHLTDLNINVHIINGEKLEEIHISDNGIGKFTVPLYGLPNLRVLDISNNNGFIMSATFLNGFPSLSHLNMANMNLDTKFIADKSNQLFLKLTQLESLKLSDNDLTMLAKNTFRASPYLSVLGLAGNRFISVPIELHHVPHLCSLDLRRNSIRKLSVDDVTSLEAHTIVAKSFTLYLDGNDFYCGCKSLRFLSWLRRTRIHLDNNRNYSCTLDSGIRTTTKELKDMEDMQRVCLGESAFWLSLVLACLMMLSFLCCITILKFKTQFQAFIIRSLWNPFFMKTPGDFRTGVYIGYADHDSHLACQVLRRFIEEELRLSTYVRHRDLLPASDMAEAITESINSSWRVLLVVSQHFLNDSWSFFALKVSTYAVQCENPGRLVLVLTDGDQQESLMSKLPDCILQVVREESIITMTSRGRISYEYKQALKTALLYQG